MDSLCIEYHAPDQLKPFPRNARTHSKKQIRQIADSVRQFGFTNPILIDREHMILAGHGRVEAARFLGLTSIPCIRIDHMSPEQKRAYILADNKLAQNAGWDDEILATALQFLLATEIDFNIGITGKTGD
jgi:ParB-like chromosome segregation protein Spo0J